MRIGRSERSWRDANSCEAKGLNRIVKMTERQRPRARRIDGDRQATETTESERMWHGDKPEVALGHGPDAVDDPKANGDNRHAITVGVHLTKSLSVDLRKMGEIGLGANRTCLIDLAKQARAVQVE